MKAHELWELSVEELQAKQKELNEELFHTRMKLVSGEIENTSKLKNDRRELARIKTILREKQQAAG